MTEFTLTPKQVKDTYLARDHVLAGWKEPMENASPEYRRAFAEQKKLLAQKKFTKAAKQEQQNNPIRVITPRAGESKNVYPLRPCKAVRVTNNNDGPSAA